MSNFSVPELTPEQAGQIAGGVGAGIVGNTVVAPAVKAVGAVKAARAADVAAATAKLAKVAKMAGAAFGATGDVVAGGIAIGTTANDQFMTDSEKAYSITGDVLGIAANIAVSFVSGPLAILAILGGILDMFYSPYKAMFNKDLRRIESELKKQVKQMMKESDLDYPFEMKPDILSALANEDSLQYALFVVLRDNYYIKRGLIDEQEAATATREIQSLREERRMHRGIYLDDDGNVKLKDDTTKLMYFTAQQQEDRMLAKLITLSLTLKRNNIDVNNPKDYKSKKTLNNYLKQEWKTIMFIIVIIILSSTSSILSGVFATIK